MRFLLSVSLSFAAIFLLFVIFLARNVTGLDNGAGRTPPLGWSTWCSGGKCGNDYCDEEMILSAAHAMQSNGMQSVGWTHIILDDCFILSRNDTSGQLIVDPNRFPRGMKAVADDLHGMNFSLGLYTSVGNVTCNNHGEPAATPGSEGHFETDVETFGDWGADYIKGDACGDVKKHFIKGPPNYIEMSNAVKNYSKRERPIFFECVGGYPFLLMEVPKYCNSWRTSSDHHDRWQSTHSCIEMQGYLALEGRPGAWNHMDILTIGGEGCPPPASPMSHCPKQTDDEYLTEFSLWAISQSPLLVATDVRNMTHVMTQALLNKEILEMHQNVETKPGKRLAHDLACSEHLSCEIWGRKMSDGSVFVILYNAGDKDHSISAGFHEWGWGKEEEATVSNLWTKEVTRVKGKLTADVKAHAVFFAKLEKN